MQFLRAAACSVSNNGVPGERGRVNEGGKLPDATDTPSSESPAPKRIPQNTGARRNQGLPGGAGADIARPGGGKWRGSGIWALSGAPEKKPGAEEQGIAPWGRAGWEGGVGPSISRSEEGRGRSRRAGDRDSDRIAADERRTDTGRRRAQRAGRLTTRRGRRKPPAAPRRTSVPDPVVQRPGTSTSAKTAAGRPG